MSSPSDPSPVPPPIEPVTLDNCEREPIHIPGSIQPHGALLGFDRLGRLVFKSANADALLGFTLTLGRAARLADLGGDETVYQLIQQMLADAADDEVPLLSSHEVQRGDQTFDLVAHASHGVSVCEFERRVRSDDEVADFAQKAYRSMDSLKRQRSVDKLLQAAVQGVRAMTGFDRVMAYRFRHDDSGDVVAEARREDLDAYLGRRYPASDIPAQARRLYTLNTLRLIADVRYTPVPLLAHADQTEPLDLSHSVLRSVSPIHVEYLRNMGVAASMSVSIVVGGRLWGMLACHHMTPLQVPFSIRMAADVMAQVIASSVQSLLAQGREAVMARAALLRTDLTGQIAEGHDALDVLTREAPAVQASLDGAAVITSLDGKHHLHGDVDPAWAGLVVAALERRGQSIVHIDRGENLPATEAGTVPFCGALGLCFDRPRQGWIVVLRREQVQTIVWGGKPDKDIAYGPLGPRLTPRGSFAEWRETVRNTSEPWDATLQEVASLLLDSVSRAHAVRVLELDRLRSQLWAILGHDLRDPLQSLSMAAHVLDRGGSASRMTGVIKNSASRMQRLLSDLQDVTRAQNGLALAINAEPTDLSALVAQLVHDAKVAYPTDDIAVSVPDALVAEVDPSRYTQVVSNLVSNARHHGAGGITLALSVRGEQAVLVVTNVAEPIPADMIEGLFDPFKRRGTPNARNPGSLGLGLYIARQVMAAHGGTLDYAGADGRVAFTAALPLARPPAASVEEGAARP